MSKFPPIPYGDLANAAAKAAKGYLGKSRPAPIQPIHVIHTLDPMQLDAILQAIATRGTQEGIDSAARNMHRSLDRIDDTIGDAMPASPKT